MKDVWKTELTKNARGGTEILAERLFAEFGPELEQFQIIPSRVGELQRDKIRILWVHDLGEDPMNHHLANGGWDKFHKIVFVSYMQREDYLLRYGIPPSMTTVLHNSIVPIECNIEDKPKDRIDIVYTPTPHRGLGLLVPVFEKLAEKHADIHLHVYSSFELYGWKESDTPYLPLFEHIKSHPKMTYYGSVSNEEIRESLKSKHIFAYPSIWKETSSLCLMEAMSAGLACVHSSLGALPETASNWTFQYDFDEEHNRHANKFYPLMEHVINLIRDSPPYVELRSQKSYTDLFYSWDLRKYQWKDLFDNLIQENKDKSLDLPKEKFSYGA